MPKPEQSPPPRETREGIGPSPWVAALLPLFVVVGALVAVAASLQVVERRTEERRILAVGTIDPARAELSALKGVLAREVSERRAYLLAMDTTYLMGYRALFREETQRVERLRERLSPLGPAAVAEVDRLSAALGDWHRAGLDRMLLGSEQLTATRAAELLPQAQTAFEGAIAAADRLDGVLRAGEEALRAESTAAGRLATRLTMALLILALLGGGALAWTALHMRDLALEAARRRAELRRASEERDRFLRGITHDLKNPLTVVDAYVQILEAELRGPITDAQRVVLGRLRQAVQEALATVADVLELARAAGSTPTVRPQAVDLRKLVQDVAAEYRVSAEMAKVDLDVEPGDPTEPVRTDPVRVRQILGNLLTNAVKYTPGGGQVAVRLSGVDEAPPTLEGTSDLVAPHWLRITVSDTGPGIPAEDLERIFEEYYRAPGTAGRGGAGVGLATARRLARLLGGEVTVDPNPRSGARFHLWLPSEIAAQSAPAPAAVH